MNGLAAGGAVAATTGLASCTTNAATGRKQFVGLAPGAGQLSNMAAASWSEMKQKIPTSTDPRYTSRLRNIGNRISRGAGKSSETWDYAVFDQDTKNAFVLPGNRVGFYKGMMDFTDNDDQIAGIMGHEVGHVTGEHARERYSMQMAQQVAVAGTAIIGGTTLSKKCKSAKSRTEYNNCMRSAQQKTQYLVQAIGLGSMIGLVLPYSRKHESESDLLGVNYMHKAGYDPYQSVKLWEKMAANNPRRQPEFLSTHPDPANRAKVLHEYIKRQEALGSQGFTNIQT
jgi:predicted Zn-dependent protease